MRTQRALNSTSSNNNNNNNSTTTTTTTMTDNDNEQEEKNAEEIIEEVVGMEQWKDKRANKLDLDDFLALLAEFNKSCA